MTVEEDVAGKPVNGDNGSSKNADGSLKKTGIYLSGRLHEKKSAKKL